MKGPGPGVWAPCIPGCFSHAGCYKGNKCSHLMTWVFMLSRPGPGKRIQTFPEVNKNVEGLTCSLLQVGENKCNWLPGLEKALRKLEAKTEGKAAQPFPQLASAPAAVPPSIPTRMSPVWSPGQCAFTARRFSELAVRGEEEDLKMASYVVPVGVWMSENIDVRC